MVQHRGKALLEESPCPGKGLRAAHTLAGERGGPWAGGSAGHYGASDRSAPHTLPAWLTGACGRGAMGSRTEQHHSCGFT